MEWIPIKKKKKKSTIPTTNLAPTHDESCHSYNPGWFSKMVWLVAVTGHCKTGIDLLFKKTTDVVSGKSSVERAPHPPIVQPPLTNDDVHVTPHGTYKDC